MALCVTRPLLSATVCVNCARAVCVSRTKARRRSSVARAGARERERQREARASATIRCACDQFSAPNSVPGNVREAIADRIEDQVGVLQAALVLRVPAYRWY